MPSKTADLVHTDTARFISPAKTFLLSCRLFVVFILRSPGDLKLNMSKIKFMVFYWSPVPLPPLQNNKCNNSPHTHIPGSLPGSPVSVSMSFLTPPSASFPISSHHQIGPLYPSLKCVQVSQLHNTTSDHMTLISLQE